MADLPLYVFGAMTSRRLAFHFHLIVVEEANGNVTKSQPHCFNLIFTRHPSGQWPQWVASEVHCGIAATGENGKF